jgi:phage baseplate assembly protein W
MYTDISLDVNSIHPITGDLVTLRDESAIKQSIRNLILTNRESIPWNRNKGTNIYSYVFEQNSVIMEVGIRELISSIIRAFEPRVELYDVSVERDGNSVKILIMYEILKLNKVDNVNITIGSSR